MEIRGGCKEHLLCVDTAHSCIPSPSLSPLPYSWCLSTVQSGLSLWGPLAFTSGVVGLQVCTMSSCVCGTGLKPTVWGLPGRLAFYQPLGKLEWSHGATRGAQIGVLFRGVLKESPTVVRTTRCDPSLRPRDMCVSVSPGFAPGAVGSRGNWEEGWEGPA